MDKNLKLISAQYFGGYNDSTIYDVIINYYDKVIHIGVERHYRDLETPNTVWEVITDKNISYNEMKEILKTIVMDKPIYLSDVYPKVYNKKIESSNGELKTLEGWHNSRDKELTDYLKIGDRVDKEFLNYFINELPPKKMTGGIVQIAEAFSVTKNGKNTYITFAKDVSSEDWYYRGACTLGSIVNEERKFDEFDMTYIEENKKIIEIKAYAEYIYEFLKTQKESQLMDFDLLKILQDRKYILPKDTPEDLQNKLDKMLETLWSELEDIPFYTKDGIEYLDGDYLDFTPGITTKEDIWHWFDERHSNGIHYLLYEYEIESRFTKDKSYEPIYNTDRLIEEIRKINILKYDELIKIADRLEMFDNSYMFELREVILDEAQVIKMNNFDKKYDSDEIMKNDLIKGIKDIATMYCISEENENTRG